MKLLILTVLLITSTHATDTMEDFTTGCDEVTRVCGTINP